MKIAMLGLRGIPATYGGIEKHVEELSVRLVKMGHDVTVYCRDSYVETKENEHRGVKLRKLPCINTKSLEAATHTFIASLDLLPRHFDIVHYHALGPSVFSVIPRVFGKNIVVTIHGLDWQREKWGRGAKAFLKLGERTAVLVPRATISVSRSLRDHLQQKYGRQVDYIPSGVTDPVFRQPELIKKEYGLEGHDYILFVARLVPEKGCHFLLDAYAKLKPGMRLMVVGGSSHTDEYVEQLRAKATDGVTFTGYLYGDILQELYSNAYCYIHPSTLEGLPITLMEAASYGNCIITSDIPPNLEVVTEIGLTFPSGDADGLMEQLRKTLEQPDLAAELRRKARDRGVSEYSYDRVAEQTEAVYQRVLDTKRNMRSAGS